MNPSFWHLAASLAFACAATVPAEAALDDFIRVRGDQLVEHGQPFRFVSFNIPNLLLVEDNMPFEVTNAWRLPNRFEITDALQSVRQEGGLVARAYTITVAQPGDPSNVSRHVLGPGRFNEEAFRVMDEVLQIANQTGVRLIIPLVNNWGAMGGRGEYAGFRGRGKDAFWSDPEIIADFKKTIDYVLNRTNALTGVPYRDDQAILCWETRNELQSPASWTREIAAYIKSIDTNHLLMDGFYTTTKLRPESLEIPDVDIVSSHHYPDKGAVTFADCARTNRAMAKGKKPYVVGEFGFVDTAEIKEMLEAVRESCASGSLAWSLRFRDRYGGFYWHTEPSGGDKYKAFHWPGFPSGADYDEQNLLALMRREAFQIRGLPMPEIPPPAAPTLLPFTDAAAISWQGCVGAASYVVERAGARDGPWTVASDNVDETTVQYRPLFVDTNVGRGQWWYRVRARNQSGVSEPSNIAGPVRVRHATLVDEMADFSQVYAHGGPLEFRTRDCRRAKEDAHRLAGGAGSAIIYRVGETLRECKLYAFFPDEAADLTLATSADGEHFTEVAAAKQSYAVEAGQYGYWRPVSYDAKLTGAKAQFLRIEYHGEAQIGRVEIQYQ